MVSTIDFPNGTNPMIWRKLHCSLLCSFLPCHSWCRHRQTSTGKTYIYIYVCCRCIANQLLYIYIYILLYIYMYVCMSSYYFLPNCICYSDIMFAHVTATQRRVENTWKQRHIIRVQISSHVEPWHPMQLMDTPVMMSVPPGHFRCLVLQDRDPDVRGMDVQSSL